MPNVYCKICGTEFYAKPNWLKKGQGKYCSVACRGKAQERGRFVNCHVCGKTIWRPLRQLKRSKSKQYFCTKDCMLRWLNEGRCGPEHPNWKGGRRLYKRTYRNLITIKGITPICELCGIKDERVLLVHHRDENRTNNDIKNLVCLCYNCHHLVHNCSVSI